MCRFNHTDENRIPQQCPDVSSTSPAEEGGQDWAKQVSNVDKSWMRKRWLVRTHQTVWSSMDQKSFWPCTLYQAMHINGPVCTSLCLACFGWLRCGASRSWAPGLRVNRSNHGLLLTSKALRRWNMMEKNQRIPPAAPATSFCLIVVSICISFLHSAHIGNDDLLWSGAPSHSQTIDDTWKYL